MPLPDRNSALPAELQQLRPYAEQGLRLEERVRIYVQDLAREPGFEVRPSPVITDLQRTFEAWISTLPKSRG